MGQLKPSNQGSYELVAVHVPGLARPLYGEVIQRDRKQVTVRVFKDSQHAVMTVDVEMVTPWYERTAKPRP